LVALAVSLWRLAAIDSTAAFLLSIGSAEFRSLGIHTYS
jgi:hypothetical protein